MNRIEAENLIFKSFMEAQKHIDFNKKDSKKRHPYLTKELLISDTPSVVITGSKGKGSIARMLEILLRNKYKTGLFTSPHITTFNERFKVDGVNITDEVFTEEMEEIKKYLYSLNLPANIPISPIGIQAGLAIRFFNREKTEYNIFECGKGARYDDVNNIEREYSIIGRIFLEHKRELGDTIEEIALDKSYIIKGNERAVFMAEQLPSVREIIRDRAEKMKVPLFEYGRDFYSKDIKNTDRGLIFNVIIKDKSYEVTLPLLGEFQAENCAIAMAVAKEIMGVLFDKVGALSQLEYPGRMEILNNDPLTLLDATINRESAKEVLKALDKNKKYNFLIAIPDDKDYLGVAKEIEKMAKKIILTRCQNPYYIFSDKQALDLSKEGIEFFTADSLKEALSMVEGDVIILGTTSLIIEAKEIY